MTAGSTGSPAFVGCSGGRRWPSAATRWEVAGLVVCGTRGAAVDRDDPSAEIGEELRRELSALDGALRAAKRLRSAGVPLFVLWHYPPFSMVGRPGPVVSRLEEAHATGCVFGHVHTEGQWAGVVQGEVQGVRYHCVAADAVGFRPLRLATLG